MAFSGFTRDTLYTPVPNPLFGPLLEQIEDLAELKVTLRAMWLLHRKRNRRHMLSQGELLNDRSLLRGLAIQGKDAEAEILRGLRLAVERRTFLVYQPPDSSPEGEYYLLNTESNHSMLDRLRAEGISGSWEEEPMTPDPPMEPEQKPNIFALYEDNVGMLSPILTEELKEAEELYAWSWIREAFEIAVTENKRSWRYIAGILRRWAAEGKGHGKPGRHPETDNRQKFIADYQRRWGSSSGDRAAR